MNGELAYPLFCLLAVSLPLLLSLLLVFPRLRSVAQVCAPWAAAPALGLALCAAPGAVVQVPLLLGMELGLDSTTQTFLLFTAALWIIAGLYARTYLAHDAAPQRFFGFYLLTMCGNLGVILARDLVSFYVFFTLMGFAAYGLVVHEGTSQALRAARVYLILVIIGEALLLPALLLAAASVDGYSLVEVPTAIAQSPQRNLIVVLLLAGFGIKAGALPLHVWLPLAHPAAPTPASALLSGTMIKAGLLGWVLFLPLGVVALPAWGALCITAGLGAAFYGVAIGLTQSHPKTILAYSSISQMGLMTVALGVALSVPAARGVALTAIIVYAAHHAMAKGALFLGVGVVSHGRSAWQGLLFALGLGLAALALAGAPLTSGAVAKTFLKSAIEALSDPWPARVELLLQLAAIGTTLLMGRFLLVVWPRDRQSHTQITPGLWLPWAASLVLVAGGMFALPEGPLAVINRALTFSALWPVVAGGLLVLGAWYLQRRVGARLGPELPEGDLLIPITWLLGYLRVIAVNHVVPGWYALAQRGARGARWFQRGADIRENLAQVEHWLSSWIVAGTIFTLLVTMFLAITLLT